MQWTANNEAGYTYMSNLTKHRPSTNQLVTHLHSCRTKVVLHLRLTWTKSMNTCVIK